MLICCGTMLAIFGALSISSVATAIGLSTGQTSLAIAGFVLAAGIVVVQLYRRHTSNEDNSSRLSNEVKTDQQ
jgi:membrane protein implicated in regulation of membrane protease activity